ncbi:hypothetical protein Tco_1153686 [Tanacetum coccineum]
MSIRAMQTDIMRKYKCKVSTGKCSRAKKKVLDEYEGGLKDHYSRLCDYGAEILKTNPSSSVMMSINTMSDENLIPYSDADLTSKSSCCLDLTYSVRACDAFENGMSESFNSRIRKARRKPIITILEEISTYVMRRNFRMATKGKKLEHDVCPTIRKKLEEIKVKQRHWNVIPSDCNQFEVVNEYDAYAVDISARTCSCRSCQLSGIPYVHAVTVLAFLNKDPETYVSDWLKKDMFTKAYNYPIKPLKGSSFWPKIDHIKPLPPNERRVPGRPTVNRKRDPSEKETKRRTTKGGEAKSTTIHIPASPGVLPHFARDDDVGDQMAGQESQTIDEV